MKIFKVDSTEADVLNLQSDVIFLDEYCTNNMVELEIEQSDCSVVTCCRNFERHEI